jgi:hypothetical protein
MPILLLALLALAVFLSMGIMFFYATLAEKRDRKKRMAATGAGTSESEKPKANAARA